MTKRNVKKDKTSLQSFPFPLLYLALVIAIAFGLRVAKLNNLPLSLSLDEATNGLDALQLFRLKWFTPYLQNNFGRETLFSTSKPWPFGFTVFLFSPSDLAPGQYTLRAGLYQPETGQRLSLKNQPQDFVDFPNLITVQ